MFSTHSRASAVARSEPCSSPAGGHTVKECLEWTRERERQNLELGSDFHELTFQTLLLGGQGARWICEQ